ncbi:YicC family protein [Bacillus sp. AGMB 02131]|uniref:YicC family protein n=1 Tax=Peribacillus faecalis TaxID=2772559 RepID=A0A927CSU4_9BACI|nr:YicC/YloC family endoribonuclease [Peribacillus faecalis]MBD3106786.1 YicC family protein [Peribacillus faecalis]
MIVSMTGYGLGTSESERLKVRAEVKTVNHRFSEFYVRMPRQLLVLEDKIKKLLATYIRRGRAEIFITIDGEGLLTKRLEVDWSLLDQYMSHLNEVTYKYNLHPNDALQNITHLEGIFHIHEEQTNTSEVEELVMEAVKQAGEQLLAMRKAEGMRLQEDIAEQLKNFSDAADQVKEYAPLVLEQYKQRLQTRMTEFASGIIDETRMLNEVAIFTDKADINEEITRLKSHLSQVYETIESDAAIGRKLDFLVQEMNREVNTIGSKANDAKIASQVVEMKSLLEKIKEQVQNIE